MVSSIHLNRREHGDNEPHWVDLVENDESMSFDLRKECFFVRTWQREFMAKKHFRVLLKNFLAAELPLIIFIYIHSPEPIGNKSEHKILYDAVKFMTLPS